MGFGDSLLVKPGTVFMFILILVMGIGVFHWASGTIKESSKNSMDKQDDAFKCSGINVELANLRTSNNTVNAFFIVNRDVDRVYVNFEGDRNVTREVEYGGQNSLSNVSVTLEGFEEVSFRAPPCEQRFIFKSP